MSAVRHASLQAVSSEGRLQGRDSAAGVRRGYRVTTLEEYAERAVLNASRQQAFTTITTYLESSVDPLHMDNSNAGWYHYL
ncbi:uncharacterized protein TrAFT101_001843 [Trichoderma asperellum]|uniref:uncharacterized protein n=1 Tax=Trichoderma asperellum TaxID=101201 RepID=UPI0033252A84|nr:hypothetical protein TrAFT101_001843 [Trichoderma asperellum]